MKTSRKFLIRLCIIFTVLLSMGAEIYSEIHPSGGVVIYAVAAEKSIKSDFDTVADDQIDQSRSKQNVSSEKEMFLIASSLLFFSKFTPSVWQPPKSI